MRTQLIATLASVSTIALMGCSPALTTQLGRPNIIPGGRSPTFVNAADLNGDGKLDLVVTRSWGRGEVGILIGHGDGTFHDAQHLVGNGAPKTPVVVDLNGDGKLDLAVADFTQEGFLSVLLGNGDGTFHDAVNHPIGRTAFSIHSGDFNGDGKVDIIALNNRPESTTAGEELAGKLVFLAGHGDGGFSAGEFTNLGGSPRSMGNGDFDGDGKLDAMIAVSYPPGSRSELLFMRGTGDGRFVKTSVVGCPFEGLGVSPPVDFNKDGKADVSVGVNDGTVVFLANGDGTFRESGSYYTEPSRSGYSGDFDHDGNIDILTARRLLRGDGTGHFTKTSLPHVYNNDSFVIGADLNGDGWLDVVGADQFHNQIFVYMNVGGPAPVAPAPTASR